MHHFDLVKKSFNVHFSTFPALGCQKPLLSFCRSRQPPAVAIRWLPRYGGCRTRHSAIGYDWRYNLPMTG